MSRRHLRSPVNTAVNGLVHVRRALSRAASSARIDALESRRMLSAVAVSAAVGNKSTANLGSGGVDLSSDGHYATFVSNATNLVSAPLTTYYQVYRRNLVTGVNTLVSIGAGDQVEANEDASDALISATGRYVAFTTLGSNLIDDSVDTNGELDVYWRDMVTNRTVLITRTGTEAFGGQLVDISEDGQNVLFRSSASASGFVRGVSDKNLADDLFVWNNQTGKITAVSVTPDGTSTGDRVSGGNDFVGGASFSANGRFVVFPSRASNLVEDTEDGNTFQYDLFVRDLLAKTTEYVNVTADDDTLGSENSAGHAEITADGRYVAFTSIATDLTDHTTIDDTNDVADLFLRDRQTGTTKLITVNLAGDDAQNSAVESFDMTDDGRFAVYTTRASDVNAFDTNEYLDAYYVDLASGTTTLVSINTTLDSAGGGDTNEAIIANDGTTVVFSTYANNLPGDFDKRDVDFTAIYSRNMREVTDFNTVVSVDRGGNPAGADNYLPVLSRDGTRIVFTSVSRAIVKSDFNGDKPDLFTAATPGHEAVAIDEDGKITVYGSQVEDVVNIQQTTGTLTVVRDDERYTFNPADVTSIDVLAGDANDSVTVGPAVTAPAYISGGSGDDVLTAGAGDDRVQGGPGRDTIRGGGGDDRLDGGKGSDRILGEGGRDTLVGSDGNDTLDGGRGVDRVSGGIGDDVFIAIADDRADYLYGGDGADTLEAPSDASDIVDSIESTPVV